VESRGAVEKSKESEKKCRGHVDEMIADKNKNNIISVRF